MSLRRRLVLGLVMVAVVLGLVTFVVTRSTSRQFVQQVDRQLQDIAASRLERFAGRQFGDDSMPSTLYYAELFPDDTFRTRLVPNLDDRSDLPKVTAAQVRGAMLGEPFTASSREGNGRWRVLVTQGPDHLELSAISLNDVDDSVHRLLFVEILGSAAVLGALAIMGWWVVRLGVRPIKRMTAVATDIAAGDLSHRVPEPAHPGGEVAELGTALNRMLATIQDSFEERLLAEQRLKQFAADASHELRTPIATIRGYAELYRRGGLSPGPELDDAMRRSEQEAIRMGGLVDDLLHLARLDQGRPLDRRPISIDRLAEDAVNDARAIAPKRMISAFIESDVVVLGDEPRLRQVIANLLTNARVHTPEASAIGVTVRRTGTTAVLEITDHGPGMPPEVASRVFERFYRADRARSRNAGGSGLGLAIVKSTIEALGGTVGLNSSVVGGTTVRVELPVASRSALVEESRAVML